MATEDVAEGSWARCAVAYSVAFAAPGASRSLVEEWLRVMESAAAASMKAAAASGAFAFAASAASAGDGGLDGEAPGAPATVVAP